MIKINFKNLFKKKVNVPEAMPSVAWPLYYVRDWRIAVLVFAVGMISLTIFSWQIYLSDKIAGGYFEPKTEFSTISVKTINEKKLKEDISLLESRQADFIILQTKGSK
jgi:hypothetical protein